MHKAHAEKCYVKYVSGITAPLIIMNENELNNANAAQSATDAGQAQPNDANAQGATNPNANDANANANAGQNPEENEEKLSFLMEVDMKDVMERLRKRGAQIVGAQIRNLRLVELKRDDGSVYHKFVVNLKQSVRAMVNRGTREMPVWEPGYVSQVWLFPNQVLRACVEGGLDERYLAHLQSNMAVEVLLNMFMAGSLMMLAIEPVTAGEIYYSPFSGEQRGEVKNTSFYFLPYTITLPNAGLEDLVDYAKDYKKEFAMQSVKMDMMKKR